MGAVFALACDIRTMADDTLIGLPESGLAILAGATGTQRLTRTVGAATAIKLLLEGRWLTAAQAAELHLVQHLHPRDQLHAQTLAIAERLASRSPIVTREIKRPVYDTATRPTRACLRDEAARRSAPSPPTVPSMRWPATATTSPPTRRSLTR